MENKKNNKIIYLMSSLIIILVIVILVILGFNYKKFNLNTSNPKESNIELKKTESVSVKSDGVYITDVSDIVDAVMPSIVSITSKTVINSGMFGPFYENESYTAEGAGSGVIVSESDDEIYILTNYHVVKDTKELTVKFIDDNSYDANVLGVSKRKDVAIVSVNKKNIQSETLEHIKIATLGNSDELKVGNGIIAIGNALGYGQSVTTGVVSALNREVTTDEYIQDMIQIDAAINGGNSGGALLNSKGEVVGINTAKYSSNYTNSSSIEGMGFAIPISTVEPILEKLINGEDDDSSVSLGIEGYMTTSGYLAHYKLPSGFYVSAIISGGSAENSELEIGNIITHVDNTEVTSIDTIRKILNKKEKGDNIVLKIKYPNKNEYLEKEITINLN